MAIVHSNPLLQGVRGMFGNVIVFKSLRGKTIMANKPRPAQTQSEPQRQNRNKFKLAAHWAKATLLDPQQKAYYVKKARQLKLPNAYTASIADYMRTPHVKEIKRTSTDVTYRAFKKDFELKQVELRFINEAGELQEMRIIRPDRNDEWIVSLSKKDFRWRTVLNITPASNQLSSVNLSQGL